MKSSVELARGWFLKAESDLAAARRVIEGSGPYDTACFHAQQAAEKYLKGFLALAGKRIPKTHNLEELELLCADIEPKLLPGDVEIELVEMTAYGVELRYDFEFWPDRETAEEALALALIVRDRVLSFVPKEGQP
jgi:HEPN domain-containing protein